MFRLIHAGDTHFNNKFGLLRDIVKCTDALIAYAQDNPPDVLVIAGDLWDEAIQLGSPASLAGISFVQRCAEVCPTLLIRGTSTHDAENSLTPLNKLRAKYSIYVSDVLCQVVLTDAGFRSIDDVPPGEKPKCVFSLLPSVSKAGFMSIQNGGTVDETNRNGEGLLRDVLQGFGVINQEARESGIATVLVGHATVIGSETSTGQIMIGRDLEVSPGDLHLAGADVNCMAHIHKSQVIAGNIWYCGSATRLNFGESEEKVFLVHTIEDGKVSTVPVPLPARPMVTIRSDGIPDASIVNDVKEGDSVRLVYEVAEEDVSRVDENAIEKAALAAGASEVKIEKKIIVKQRVRAEGISQLHGNVDKLHKWGETTGTEITPALIAKLDVLETHEAERIIESYEQKPVDKPSEVR